MTAASSTKGWTTALRLQVLSLLSTTGSTRLQASSFKSAHDLTATRDPQSSSSEAPYLPRDRGSRKRPRRRRRRGRREYAAADDKAGDDTTDMYDKDEGDSDGGVGGEGRGSGCCDASAVPSRVTPAYLAGDHNRVASAYSAAVTIASTRPYVLAPFPPTISISSRPHLATSAHAARNAGSVPDDEYATVEA
jgi:hypothetical protein